MLSAGEKLRAVQEGLAQGRADAGQLRRAGDQERHAISALVEAARGLPGGEQLSETALERLRETLHATALDEETRRQVEAGRLRQEASAVGFGPMPGAAPATPGRKVGGGTAAEDGREKGADEKRRQKTARERERDELRRLEARVKEEKRAVSAAREALRKTTRERDRLQKRVDEEHGKAEETQGRLERLEQEAKEARRRVTELGQARSR